MYLKVYTDGGARGNPGIAGIGVYIVDAQGKALERRYKYIGETTNNVAEYTGALYGLRRAVELGASQVDLFMDSKLVISQLSGEWKIKDANLKTIHSEICVIIGDLQVSYNWIPREQNKDADALSNKAMDDHNERIII